MLRALEQALLNFFRPSLESITTGDTLVIRLFRKKSIFAGGAQRKCRRAGSGMCSVSRAGAGPGTLGPQSACYGVQQPPSQEHGASSLMTFLIMIIFNI